MTRPTRAPDGHLCGASHPRAKLTTEQVRQMRAHYEEGGMGYESLSLIYKCGISTVRDIVQYRTRIAG